MIQFEPGKGQKQLVEMAHWFAKEQIRPIALEADKAHCVPDHFLQMAHQMGIHQGGVVEEPFGKPKKENASKERKTNRTSALLAEEMAWGDPAVLLSLPGPGLGGPPVRFMGTKEQRARFLGIFKDTSGPAKWGAYALTEPSAGSDAKAIKTSCRKEGEEYILNGRKCYITNGARADWVVCFATTDPALGRAGHRAFVVEKGTPGFEVGRLEEKIGLRASETAELVLDNARVPAENLLGGEEHYGKKQGFVGAMKTFDSTRPLVAAMAVGIARAALEEVQSFFQDNYLTGRAIPRYEAIRDQLAVGFRRIHAARLLCWRAAWMADLEIPNAKEASISKAYAAQEAVRVCSDAVMFLGAHGALRNSLVEKFYRDIKVFDIFEGTGQIQRIVISRRIIPGLKGF